MTRILFVILSAFLIYSCASDNNTVEPDIPFNLTAVPDTLYSYIVGDVYRLHYRLPSGYDHNKSEGYPVIFVLDGDYILYDDYSTHTGGMVGIADSLHRDGLLPDCIIVGVGYKYRDQRARDFLYPYDDINFESGGGDKYYFFLKDELIPFIDEHFNTAGVEDRTLLGYSAGGNAIMYAMFQYDQNEGTVFQHYLAASPRLYYHNFYLLDIAKSCYERTPDNYPFDFYMGQGTGKFELYMETLDSFVRPFQNLYLHNFDRFKLDIFPEVNHADAFRYCFYSGLRYLFNE